jgi:hypothetical protein
MRRENSKVAILPELHGSGRLLIPAFGGQCEPTPRGLFQILAKFPADRSISPGSFFLARLQLAGNRC